MEDVIKKDYDLSARNPNKMKAEIYKEPKELAEGIMEKEDKIKNLLLDIKDLFK